jgi:hypothetical protein
VIDEVSVIDAYEPWLTLIGLRLTYERNVADRADRADRAERVLDRAQSADGVGRGDGQAQRAGAGVAGSAGAGAAGSGAAGSGAAGARAAGGDTPVTG